MAAVSRSELETKEEHQAPGVGLEQLRQDKQLERTRIAAGISSRWCGCSVLPVEVTQPFYSIWHGLVLPCGGAVRGAETDLFMEDKGPRGRGFLTIITLAKPPLSIYA
jgi:hypothetical protein